MALYLVTGGAGFVGSHVATALVERGDRVRVLDDLSTGDRANLAHLGLGEAGSQVELVHASVTDPAALDEACRGARGVFHQAARVSVPQSVAQPAASYEVNVMGTLRLLEAARRAGVERVVLAASSAAYGDPERLPCEETMPPRPASPYASGKLAGEHLLEVWARAHGMHAVSLRYFNVYGPRQADDSPYTGVIAIFARALLRAEEARIFGDGEQTRDFVHASDVARANLIAMDASVVSGRVFNVGTGVRVTVNELWSRMAELCGSVRTIERAPERPGDVRHSVAATERARDELGFEARMPWSEGLAETVDWYRGRFAAAAD